MIPRLLIRSSGESGNEANNKKKLEMQEVELFQSFSGTHAQDTKMYIVTVVCMSCKVI